MKKIDWKRLIIIIIITFVVGSFLNFFTMNNMDTFKELEKPINLPGILFPIVWSVLYLLMSVSLYIVTKKDEKTNTCALIVYGVQLIINSLVLVHIYSHLYGFFYLLYQ